MWWLGFPTSGYPGRIPVELLQRMDEAHEKEVSGHVPLDAEALQRSRMSAMALNTLNRVARLLGERTIAKDWAWGGARARVRLCFVIEAFIAFSESCGELPALRIQLGNLKAALERKWRGLVPSLAQYPALAAGLPKVAR